jgi:hypothetical protein
VGRAVGIVRGCPEEAVRTEGEMSSRRRARERKWDRRSEEELEKFSKYIQGVELRWTVPGAVLFVSYRALSYDLDLLHLVL